MRVRHELPVVGRDSWANAGLTEGEGVTLSCGPAGSWQPAYERSSPLMLRLVILMPETSSCTPNVLWACQGQPASGASLLRARMTLTPLPGCCLSIGPERDSAPALLGHEGLLNPLLIALELFEGLLC